MQRAVSTTKTMVKCLMAMASLEQSQGARLVSSLRIYSVVRRRTCFRSTKRTGIEGLMQQSGEKFSQGFGILSHLPCSSATAA